VKTRDKQYATMQVNACGTNVARWCGRAVYNIRYYRMVAGPRPTVNSLLKPRRRRERSVRNGLLSRFPGGTCIRTFASVRVCACARASERVNEQASKQQWRRRRQRRARLHCLYVVEYYCGVMVPPHASGDSCFGSDDSIACVRI